MHGAYSSPILERGSASECRLYLVLIEVADCQLFR